MEVKFKFLKMEHGHINMENIRFRSARGTDSDIFKLCSTIRQKVFIEEQGYSEEFDDIDNFAYHVLMYVNDKPVACGRIFEDPNAAGEYILGRICVESNARGQGFGSILVLGIESVIDAPVYKLHAQEDKKDFYVKCGYRLMSEDIDLDEGVPHVWMIKES